MNLKISPETLRFRISNSEFQQLLLAGMIEHKTQITDNIEIAYTIRLGNTKENQLLDLVATHDFGALRLVLTVSAEGINQLQADTTKKLGIQAAPTFPNNEKTAICLQIDLATKQLFVRL